MQGPILSVTTPPAPVVSLDEAKRHLRVESGDDDAVIAACVAAAQGQIDGPDGWLGRAIGVQQLELQGLAHAVRVDCWDWITLPCPPLVSVDSIIYGAGAVMLDPSLFQVGPGNVVRPIGSSIGWPWSWGDFASVRIRYTAGYPDGGTQDAPVSTVPAPIKAAILLMTADLYENRGGKVAGSLVDNPTIERLLSPFRVFA